MCAKLGLDNGLHKAYVDCRKKKNCITFSVATFCKRKRNALIWFPVPHLDTCRTILNTKFRVTKTPWRAILLLKAVLSDKYKNKACWNAAEAPWRHQQVSSEEEVWPPSVFTTSADPPRGKHDTRYYLISCPPYQ